MKVIELELKSGEWATFFISGNVTLSTFEGETRLDDGHHNNGGWRLADSYDEVKYRITKLFDLDGEI